MDKFIYEPTNKEFEENESIRRFFFNINGSQCAPKNYIVKLNIDGTPSQDCFLLDGTPVLLSSLNTAEEQKEEGLEKSPSSFHEVGENQLHPRDEEEGQPHHQHRP